MKKRGTRANVFILDCCRNIKYGSNSGGPSCTATDTETTEIPSRGGSTATDTPETKILNDTVYAYATAPNHKASDGDDGHGKSVIQGTQTRVDVG